MTASARIRDSEESLSVHSMRHDQFLKLFISSEPTVRAYIRRLVPDSNYGSDIMQNTAVVLWQKFDTFLQKHPEFDAASQLDEEIKLHFRRWSMVVARYEVLGWRRDIARDPHVFSTEFFEQLATESLERDDHLEVQRRALEHCLKRLPQDRRSQLLEAYSARNKPQEIAERTGKSLNAFYQWLHRTRLSLLKCAKQAMATHAFQ